MLGILFGSFHTFRDWGLILGRMEIATPTPKTYTLDIEGADGALDYTEFFGGVKYENTRHVFPFTITGAEEEYLARFAEIKNYLHGQRARIILDDDPAYFYSGRCTVGSLKKAKGYATFEISAECDPYRLRTEKTVVSAEIAGSGSVTLVNGRKHAVPEITTTAEMGISFAGGTYAASAGTFTLPELELPEGETVINVTGTGRIAFTWQEGDL